LKKTVTVIDVYFDTSYIAKVYLEEPESDQIRELVHSADTIHTSVWTLAEFHAVLHCYVRERALAPSVAGKLASLFLDDAQAGQWNFVPVGEALLRRTSALILSAPRNLFLRAADAVHLTTAQELGERDVWTNDRHMLSAASYFGLRGCSV
jgi:predicted nucleic acid-binding protein